MSAVSFAGSKAATRETTTRVRSSIDKPAAGHDRMLSRRSACSINPAIGREAAIAPRLRWKVDRQYLVIQPARKNHQLIGVGRDIHDRPRRSAEWIGKTVQPQLAAAEAARRLGEIINAGQDPDALDLLHRIDVSLEIAAVAIPSE